LRASHGLGVGLGGFVSELFLLDAAATAVAVGGACGTLAGLAVFVTQRSLLNKGREKVNICRKRKHIYSSYLVALLMGCSRGPSDLPSGMWSDMKVMIRKAKA
jgi:hypothetical protein